MVPTKLPKQLLGEICDYKVKWVAAADGKSSVRHRLAIDRVARYVQNPENWHSTKVLGDDDQQYVEVCDVEFEKLQVYHCDEDDVIDQFTKRGYSVAQHEAVGITVQCEPPPGCVDGEKSNTIHVRRLLGLNEFERRQFI